MTALFGIGPGNTWTSAYSTRADVSSWTRAGLPRLERRRRREFFIAPAESTPGYIRGPLFPGEWNVVLGVPQLNPEGLRYEVRR